MHQEELEALLDSRVNEIEQLKKEKMRLTRDLNETEWSLVITLLALLFAEGVIIGLLVGKADV